MLKTNCVRSAIRRTNNDCTDVRKPVQTSLQMDVSQATLNTSATCYVTSRRRKKGSSCQSASTMLPESTCTTIPSNTRDGNLVTASGNDMCTVIIIALPLYSIIIMFVDLLVLFFATTCAALLPVLRCATTCTAMSCALTHCNTTCDLLRYSLCCPAAFFHKVQS